MESPRKYQKWEPNDDELSIASSHSGLKIEEISENEAMRIEKNPSPGKIKNQHMKTSYQNLFSPNSKFVKKIGKGQTKIYCTIERMRHTHVRLSSDGNRETSIHRGETVTFPGDYEEEHRRLENENIRRDENNIVNRGEENKALEYNRESQQQSQGGLNSGVLRKSHSYEDPIIREPEVQQQLQLHESTPNIPLKSASNQTTPNKSRSQVSGIEDDISSYGSNLKKIDSIFSERR